MDNNTLKKAIQISDEIARVSKILADLDRAKSKDIGNFRLVFEQRIVDHDVKLNGWDTKDNVIIDMISEHFLARLSQLNVEFEGL